MRGLLGGNRILGQLANYDSYTPTVAADGSHTETVSPPDGEIWLLTHVVMEAYQIDAATTGEHRLTLKTTDSALGINITATVEADYNADVYMAPATFNQRISFGDNFSVVQKAVKGVVLDSSDALQLTYDNATDAEFNSDGNSNDIEFGVYGIRFDGS